jgi:hypothetical protein
MVAVMLVLPAESSVPQISDNPPGTYTTMSAAAVIIPPNMTKNCATSVHMTAFVPPNAV